jgi:Domain of unknown function (DUF4402)
MLRIGAAIAASVIFCAPMARANGATTTGHASVVLLSATAMAETSALNFNVGSTATGGTVQLSPAGNLQGARLQPNAEGQPSSFSIQGEAFAAVSISLGESTIVTGPGSALSVHAFAHSAGPTPVLDRLGGLTFSVGATLAVGPSLPPGHYSGTYTITVNY